MSTKETSKTKKAAAKPRKTDGEAKPAVKAAVKDPAGAPAKAKAATKPKTPGQTKVAATEPKAAAEPTHEEISRLAEKFWVERGWQDGHAEQDWKRAEHELRNR